MSFVASLIRLKKKVTFSSFYDLNSFLSWFIFKNREKKLPPIPAIKCISNCINNGIMASSVSEKSMKSKTHLKFDCIRNRMCHIHCTCMWLYHIILFVLLHRRSWSTRWWSLCCLCCSPSCVRGVRRMKTRRR